MTAKKMLGKIGYKANLAGSTWLVRVVLEETADFIPGQFVSLKVSEDGLRRSYSVASLPGEKHIDLVVDVSPMGVGSKYILGLQVGDAVEVLGFLGKFGVSEEAREANKHLVFVGTGSGIVPLRPMIEDLLVNKKYTGKITLVWGVRYEKDIYWQSEIDKLQREYDNFNFELVLSRPTDEWPGRRGHVGDVLDVQENKWEEKLFYLCGSKEMIEEQKTKLMGLGVKEENILFERFA